MRFAGMLQFAMRDNIIVRLQGDKTTMEARGSRNEDMNARGTTAMKRDNAYCMPLFVQSLPVSVCMFQSLYWFVSLLCGSFEPRKKIAPPSSLQSSSRRLYLGVAGGLLQERPLQFQHGNVRVKSWQPMSNSWSTSSQPDFVHALGSRNTVRNRPSKILYTELLKSCPTLGQLLANSPPHGKLQGSSLQ